MKCKRFVWCLVLALLVLAAGTASAAGEQPMEILRKSLDAGMDVLKDPRWRGEELKIQQREVLWEALRGVFNFVEISKRALARNWLLFSPAQRKEFTELFADILGHTYVGKIQEHFQGEDIHYLKQEVDPARPRAMVQTKIVNETREISIIYNLSRKKDQWRVYDVKVEGVSLVKNYRTQFNQILFKEEPDALIEKLKKKWDRMKTGDADSGKGLVASPDLK
ncbi:MAG: ABC transporter substrate-binding protein [Desulfobacterales bacterium]|nr:ABC transporter substrate-binding protein [Desulfobacterales bacterium]